MREEGTGRGWRGQWRGQGQGQRQGDNCQETKSQVKTSDSAPGRVTVQLLKVIQRSMFVSKSLRLQGWCD